MSDDSQTVLKDARAGRAPVMANSAMPDEALRTALREVVDPEVGVNIVDLGLVYGIRALRDTVHVDLTMTSMACPMTGVILDEVREVIAARVPPGTRIDVRLVWEPPWSPESMSDSAKRQLGWAS